MRSSLKAWLHVIGSVLGLLGVVFVVIRLSSYSEQIDLAKFTATVWAYMILLAISYGAATTFLVQAWRQLLIYFEISVEKKWAVKTYGISHLAKYVPGNIFHLAGRQALGLAAGLPGRALAKSVLWELVLFACAGAFLGGLASSLVWAGLPVSILLATFCAISLGTIAALRRFWSSHVGTALAWQLAFLVVSSTVFVIILMISTPITLTFSSYLSLSAAYLIAWVAGLVTPGAPAGMGIREMILLFLLKGMINEADLLVAVVLGRFVTVLGDFLFFVYAYFSPNSTEPMVSPAK